MSKFSHRMRPQKDSFPQLEQELMRITKRELKLCCQRTTYWSPTFQARRHMVTGFPHRVAASCSALVLGMAHCLIQAIQAPIE
ncbi:hypothetical protein K432DRAFT_139352 [Lepidopterella palustris CBS 459.81]|uniref:Uncharacterized protein n=1 Tax=Lepidopterella palustris CBS 459.81 TaxID=1314670 RepID=A0A8E2JBU6_9PEZI|nr:hypothetical protein K432DRAFT_139352 [Lepidopterella palustris CBS 459.81]